MSLERHHEIKIREAVRALSDSGELENLHIHRALRLLLEVLIP